MTKKKKKPSIFRISWLHLSLNDSDFVGNIHSTSHECMLLLSDQIGGWPWPHQCHGASSQSAGPGVRWPWPPQWAQVCRELLLSAWLTGRSEETWWWCSGQTCFSCWAQQAHPTACIGRRMRNIFIKIFLIFFKLEDNYNVVLLLYNNADQS